MEKRNNKITVWIIGIVFIAIVLFTWFSPKSDFSLTERRGLAKMPEFSVKSVLNATFMSGFETYAQDQFPLRDTLRTFKAVTNKYVFNHLDEHNIYVQDGYACKLDFPYNGESVKHATDRFTQIKDMFFTEDNHVFLSIIPDKGYFFKDLEKYPTMDYDKLVKDVTGNMSYAKYIDIFGTLSIEDYYYTDTHWRQEKIKKVAEKLATGLGVTLKDEYTVETLDVPFYGVYVGQSALPLKSEEISIVNSDTLKHVKVFNYENSMEISVYDKTKAFGKDPYEVFLSGPISLIEITNDNASTDKELIIFRDSFGSSISPYLFEAYAKVTLVDIRYLVPEYLSKFIEFTDQDILFMYSTSVFNSSETIK